MKYTTTLKLALCLACVGAFANAQPWTIDAGATFARFKTQAFDQTSTGIALRLGYTVTNWLSFEAGYLNPAEVHGSALPPGAISFGPSDLTLDPWLVTLAPVFTWSPLARFSMSAKTGYAHSQTHRRFVGGTTIMPGFTLGEQRNENHLFWAVELRYAVARHVSVVADYSQMKLAYVRTSLITTALRWSF
jgi:hypothetical protein